MANLNNHTTTNIDPVENWASKRTAAEIMIKEQRMKDSWDYYRQQNSLMGKYMPEYYDGEKYCRLCGGKVNPIIREGHQIELGNIINTCYNCTETILNKIFKDLIGDKKEYCMKCLYHIKACQCEEKKKLDNLKQ